MWRWDRDGPCWSALTWQRVLCPLPSMQGEWRGLSWLFWHHSQKLNTSWGPGEAPPWTRRPHRAVPVSELKRRPWSPCLSLIHCQLCCASFLKPGSVLHAPGVLVGLWGQGEHWRLAGVWKALFGPLPAGCNQDDYASWFASVTSFLDEIFVLPPLSVSRVSCGN